MPPFFFAARFGRFPALFHLRQHADASLYLLPYLRHNTCRKREKDIHTRTKLDKTQFGGTRHFIAHMGIRYDAPRHRTRDLPDQYFLSFIGLHHHRISLVQIRRLFVPCHQILAGMVTTIDHLSRYRITVHVYIGRRHKYRNLGTGSGKIFRFLHLGYIHHRTIGRCQKRSRIHLGVLPVGNTEKSQNDQQKKEGRHCQQIQGPMPGPCRQQPYKNH